MNCLKRNTLCFKTERFTYVLFMCKWLYHMNSWWLGRPEENLWLWTTIWMLGQEQNSLQEEQVLLNDESSLQATVNFENTEYCHMVHKQNWHFQLWCLHCVIILHVPTLWWPFILGLPILAFSIIWWHCVVTLIICIISINFLLISETFIFMTEQKFCTRFTMNCFLLCKTSGFKFHTAQSCSSSRTYVYSDADIYGDNLT